MEAATPIRQSRVGVVGGRLVIYELQLDDECAVRLVHERERAGDDPAKAVREAVEIGARVLDREQAGANAEYVKTEFQRASRELEREFTDKARVVAEHFGAKVDEVFAPGTASLRRAREAVRRRQLGVGANRVRELVGEALVRSREDLVRQFLGCRRFEPARGFQGRHDPRPQAGGRAPAPDPAGTAGAHRRARAPDS